MSTDSEQPGREEAPGWDAIDAVFASMYPGQQPEHWGTEIPSRVVFGGPEVLDGLSAYAATQPRAHWHWVTYGLTELYDKDGDDPNWSGWGYELVMRAPAGQAWPRDLLRNLANWSHENKTPLQVGKQMDLEMPVASGARCDLTGWGFVADASLPPIETPHGRVEFVEVIGLRPDELALWRELGGDAAQAAVQGRFSADFNRFVREPMLR